MTKPKAIFIIISISLLTLASCAAKKGGKNCDCPGFGKLEKKEAHV
jgi:hypothetical protein